MRKALIIITVTLVLLVAFLSIGCAKQSYTIRVSNTNWAEVDLLLSIFDNETTKAYMKNKLIAENTKTTYYYAKKVISYTETSVRFIDENGNEQFISADRIVIVKQ